MLYVAPPAVEVVAGGKPVTFTALIRGASGTIEWSLRPPGVGALSGATGEVVVYTSPSAVAVPTAVSLTAQAAGLSDVAVITLLPALPPVLVTPEAACLIAGGSPTTFKANLAGASGIITWLLQPPDVGTISASSGAAVTYSPPPALATQTAVTLTARVAGGASGATTITLVPAAGVFSPVVESTSPPHANPGDPAFALTVDGSNFNPSTVVRWNGTPRPTQFVTSTRIVAAIAQADVAVAGAAQVSATNGCGSSNELVFPVMRTTRLRVTTTTTGVDLDDDGYVVEYWSPNRSQWREPSVVNGSIVIDFGPDPFMAGSWSAGLAPYSVARNCSVERVFPRAVGIAPGEIEEIHIDVRCSAAGTLRLETSSVGRDVDPNGFEIELTKPPYREAFAAPSTGAVLVPRVLPGVYEVQLRDVAPNCDSDAYSRAVTILAGATGTTRFEIACAADTQLAYTAIAIDWDNLGFTEGEIHVVNSNGTGDVNLTNHPARDADPAWSPDGQRIAFTSERDGNREIYAMSGDGSATLRLTTNPAADYHPAWSPDGRRIAFTSERDGNAEVYVMNADGTGPVRLTADPAPDLFPAWSPDGATIAFTRAHDAVHRRLFTMRADGSGAAPLVGETGMASELQPDWSPDGATLAFTQEQCFEDEGGDGCGWGGIGGVGADGSWTAILAIAEDAAHFPFSDPSWSPDGRHIAYAQPYCPASYCIAPSIHVARSDGATVPVVYDGWQPAWRR